MSDNHKWFFGKNRSSSRAYRELDVLNKLKPGEAFIISYDVLEPKTRMLIKEYSLMKRTRCREWNQFTGDYCYTDKKPKINTTCMFCQNFFGLNSNKTFSSLEDPELNLLTNMYFGKDANELLLVV